MFENPWPIASKVQPQSNVGELSRSLGLIQIPAIFYAIGESDVNLLTTQGHYFSVMHFIRRPDFSALDNVYDSVHGREICTEAFKRASQFLILSGRYILIPKCAKSQGKMNSRDIPRRQDEPMKFKSCSAPYRHTVRYGLFPPHSGTKSSLKRNESCIALIGPIPEQLLYSIRPIIR